MREHPQPGAPGAREHAMLLAADEAGWGGKPVPAKIMALSAGNVEAWSRNSLKSRSPRAGSMKMPSPRVDSRPSTATTERRSDLGAERVQDQAPLTPELGGTLPAAHRQTCLLCWDRVCTVVVQPCGHLCLCAECIALTPMSEPRQWHRECPMCNCVVSGAVRLFTVEEARRRAAEEEACRRVTLLRRTRAMWEHRSTVIFLREWAACATDEARKRAESKRILVKLLNHTQLKALQGWRASAVALSTAREEEEAARRADCEVAAKRAAAEAAAAEAERARVAAVEARRAQVFAERERQKAAAEEARLEEVARRVLGKLMHKNAAAVMSTWRLKAEEMRYFRTLCARLVGQWKSKELSFGFSGWVEVVEEVKDERRKAAADADAAETQRRLEQERQVLAEAQLKRQLQTLRVEQQMLIQMLEARYQWELCEPAALVEQQRLLALR